MDPTRRLLNRVDDVEGVRAVGVVSWNWPEVQAWTQRWNAGGLDPQNPLPAPQLPPFSNAVVEDALRKLTRQVNLQTGIIHPSDCEAAFACFAELCDAQIAYDGAEIERWLITQGGWKVKDAWTLGGSRKGSSVGDIPKKASGLQWQQPRTLMES